MKNFAKIIEHDEFQIVVMLMSDEENEEHIHVVLRDESNGCTFQPKLSYGDDIDRAREKFDLFDETAAEPILDMYRQIFDQNEKH